jgi:hypothetical protein
MGSSGLEKMWPFVQLKQIFRDTHIEGRSVLASAAKAFNFVSILTSPPYFLLTTLSNDIPPLSV